MNLGQKKRDKRRVRKCIVKFHFFPTSYLVSLFFFFPNQSFLPPPSWHFWWADEKTRIHAIAGGGNFTDGLVKSVMKDWIPKEDTLATEQPVAAMQTSPSATTWPQNKSGGQTPEAEEEEQLSVLPAVPNKQRFSQFWKSPGWRHPCFSQTASSSLSDCYDHFLWGDPACYHAVPPYLQMLL